MSASGSGAAATVSGSSYGAATSGSRANVVPGGSRANAAASGSGANQAASSSRANAAACGSLPGLSAQDNPYVNISGLVLREKNTFVQCDAPGESSARRREHSAPPSAPSSSRGTSSSVGGSCTPSDDAALRGAPPDECEDDDSELMDAPSGWDEAEPANQAASSATHQKRVYNLCKNKRLRIRKFEVWAKQEIQQDPNMNIDEFPLPPFLKNCPDTELAPRMLTRLRAFQASMLAGENPDPTFRHPSTRKPPAAPASGGQSKAKPKRLVSL